MVTVQVGNAVRLERETTRLLAPAKKFVAPTDMKQGSDMERVKFAWSTTGATTSDQNNTSHGDVWSFHDGVSSSSKMNTGSASVFKSE